MSSEHLDYHVDATDQEELQSRSIFASLRAPLEFSDTRLTLFWGYPVALLK
jgi:hypothetical protein